MTTYNRIFEQWGAYGFTFYQIKTVIYRQSPSSAYKNEFSNRNVTKTENNYIQCKCGIPTYNRLDFS